MTDLKPFAKVEVLDDEKERCVRCQHANFGLYHVGQEEVVQLCLFCGNASHIWREATE